MKKENLNWALNMPELWSKLQKQRTVRCFIAENEYIH